MITALKRGEGRARNRARQRAFDQFAAGVQLPPLFPCSGFSWTPMDDRGRKLGAWHGDHRWQGSVQSASPGRQNGNYQIDQCRLLFRPVTASPRCARFCGGISKGTVYVAVRALRKLKTLRRSWESTQRRHHSVNEGCCAEFGSRDGH